MNAIGLKIRDFLFRPASARPLAALRIGLAAVLLLQAAMLVVNLHELFGFRGIVQWQALPGQPPPEMPTLTLFSQWLVPLGVAPAQSVTVVFAIYVVSLLLLLAGWQTRTAAVIAWLTHLAFKTTGATSIYGVDEFAHIALFYCVWMPVGRVWSLDAQGQPAEEPSAEARLSLRVLQFHLCVVYFASGIEKAMGEQWINGEAIWRTLMRPEFAGIDFTWLAGVPAVAIALCLATLVVEIGYPFMIWQRWTRPLWALQTIGLHVGIAIFLGLWTFALTMIVLNVAALVVSPEVCVSEVKPGRVVDRRRQKEATPELASV